MSRKEIDNVVDNIMGVSQAERDRFDVKSLRSMNLTKFIDSQIKKASCENELKQLVTVKITNKLNSEEEIGILSLSNLLGVLNKSDNELSLGLVNAIKDFYQIEKESERPTPGEASGVGITAKDIKNAKKFFEMFDEFSKAELPEKVEEE